MCTSQLNARTVVERVTADYVVDKFGAFTLVSGGLPGTGRRLGVVYHRQ
jgi:hypothetical protein